jgi:ABC-type multidrug transport system fused ATPase/permease subunit
MGAIRASLTAEAYDREYSNRELIGRIAGYFHPWWKRLLLITAMVSILSLMGAAMPILVAKGVEAVGEGLQNRRLAAILIATVLTMGVLIWLINWVRRLNTSKLIGDVILAMRADAFDAVMNHDMSFFDKYQSGRIVSRITSDTDEFGRVAVLITELFTQLLVVVILMVSGFFGEARETGMEADISAVKSAVDSYITGCTCMPTENGSLPPAGEYALIDFNASCGICSESETFYPYFLAKLPRHWVEGVWRIDSAALVSVDLAPEEY